ncbi:malate dehydrogenase (quinone) [Nocardia stercoris]|uniref:Probable malate:quinone oxidoreductase n=1 Tax=Nocardia stercoris TaxID=2483361 RepID=A0A3M2LEN4_9NOCA|nr:malate dehydrogenase (quinone) [Nocardia stercoris]
MEKTDVVLIGAGIMSATLGALLRQVQPDWTISMFERIDAASPESSDPWNNAGTGHSALCELNYTPQNADGSVDVSKAIDINERFQVSRQFWAYGVENGLLSEPSQFINPVPHVSFCHGADGVDYLRKRHAALSRHPLFEGMRFIDDPAEFADRLPLMSRGRDFDEPVALNWTDYGTDVDFGSLTTQLLAYLGRSGVDISFGSEVRDLAKQSDGSWNVKVRNTRNHETRVVNAKFVFVGAGGYALPLLQKAGIPEMSGIGGFPVSGLFLRCTNPELVDQHEAKVYGKAAVGAPPMSVPHLDTRVIKGRKGLLFGPYAGWTPKFLKDGRYTDLIKSVKPNNLMSMVGVGLTEMGLTKYLISEVLKSQSGRVYAMEEFIPRADGGDWELITAGQRVQVIRRKGMGGVLEFGTAVIAAQDGSISGLLGASPGASTCVSAMLDVMQQCFPKEYTAWQPKLQEMVPSLGVKLSENQALFADVWNWTSKSLNLTGVPVTQ